METIAIRGSASLSSHPFRRPDGDTRSGRRLIRTRLPTRANESAGSARPEVRHAGFAVRPRRSDRGRRRMHVAPRRRVRRSGGARNGGARARRANRGARRDARRGEGPCDGDTGARRTRDGCPHVARGNGREFLVRDGYRHRGCVRDRVGRRYRHAAELRLRRNGSRSAAGSRLLRGVAVSGARPPRAGTLCRDQRCCLHVEFRGIRSIGDGYRELGDRYRHRELGRGRRGSLGRTRQDGHPKASVVDRIVFGADGASGIRRDGAAASRRGRACRRSHGASRVRRDRAPGRQAVARALLSPAARDRGAASIRRRVQNQRRMSMVCLNVAPVIA